MIAYFDTSAIIPLLVTEPGSATAERIWMAADRAVSLRLVYAEARAALAQARRIGRLAPTEAATAVRGLDALYAQVSRVEADDLLVRRAGGLADELGLRGHDAMHLAGAERVAGNEVVLIAGDRALTDAATALGIAVVRL